MTILAPAVCYPALDYPAAEPARERTAMPIERRTHSEKMERRRANVAAWLAANTPARPRPEPGQFTLLDLADDVCRWPVSEAAPYFFCGTATSCAPYCAAHAAISYVAPKSPSRKHF